jgi:hypothetical protein
MRAPRTGITAQSGLPVDFLSAPALGITGVGDVAGAIAAATGVGAMATVGDGAELVQDTDSMVATPVAGILADTAELAQGLEAASMAAVDSTVAGEAASTVAVADTANR